MSCKVTVVLSSLSSTAPSPLTAMKAPPAARVAFVAFASCEIEGDNASNSMMMDMMYMQASERMVDSARTMPQTVL